MGHMPALPSILTSCAGKLYAGRALARMMIWLTNWRQVWSAYRSGQRLPALRLRSGLVIRHADGDDPLMLLNEIFVKRSYRQRRRTPQARMLVDIGANIGVVTLTWANRFPQARIHAYEPHPRTYRTLAMNVRDNALDGRVETFSEAVGRTAGHLALSSPFISALATAYAHTATEAVQVPCVDANEVARRAGGSIDVLKIDAEGAEADILESATPATLTAITELMLEYHDQLAPRALDRCMRVLQAAGFQLRIRPANAHQGLLYAWRGHS